MRKNGFTLIELLAVVVILGITFMFVLPSVTELVKLGDKSETDLIEEKIISAAKDYTNNYDSSFFKDLVIEGDTKYVYEYDLLKFNLISEEEISELENFVGVKVELIANDKLKYTIEFENE